MTRRAETIYFDFFMCNSLQIFNFALFYAESRFSAAKIVKKTEFPNVRRNESFKTPPFGASDTLPRRPAVLHPFPGPDGPRRYPQGGHRPRARRAGPRMLLQTIQRERHRPERGLAPGRANQR